MNYKYIFKAVAVSAVAAVFSIGCGGGGDGGNPTVGGNARDAKTYTGTANGVTYTLKIEDGGTSPRAALTPTSGDKYTLTQTANSQKSTGTVKKVVGGELTLAPKEDPDDEFTATVSGDGITAMSGDITWDDGTANKAPETLTPSGGIGPGPGTDPGIDSSWKWTAVEDNTLFQQAGTIRAIAYGNNRFVAVGGITVAYSANGASWTALEVSAFKGEGLEGGYIKGIAYGNNRFVAVGYINMTYSPLLIRPGKMAYSDDGESWTAVSNSTFEAERNEINAIAYGNNRFVAVGQQGKMAYSDDGVSWTAVTDSKFGTSHIEAIAYGNNRFVAGGWDGKMAYSSDGASWTAVANSTIWDYTIGNESGKDIINAVTYGNNRFVAVGGSHIAYSENGASWTAVSSTNSPFNEYSTINAIAYGNNRFVVGDRNGNIAYSANGASWTAVSTNGASWTYDSHNIFGGYTINAIAYGNNRFVAGGDGGKMAYADW